MFRIAFSTIIHRKKNSGFYFALLLLVFILVLTVLPLFNGITSSIAAAGAAKYGTHDIVLYNLTEAQLGKLKKDSLIKLGILETYGAWELENSSVENPNTITLGNFDNTAWEFSHIQVLQGRLPEKETEIALEQNAKFRLGIDIALGQELTLKQEGIARTFTVTGIISNYTNHWSVPENNTLIKGYNDLPQGLVAPQANAAIKRLNTLSYTDGMGSIVYSLALEWQVDNASNGSYHWGVLEGQLGPINMFRNIFVIIIIFGVVLAVNTGLSLYIDSYKNTYQTLYALGAEDTFTFRLFATQQLILLVGSAILSIPLAYLVTVIAKAILGNDIAISIFTPGTFILLGIAIVLLVALALYKFNRSIHSIRGKSISLTKNKKIKQMQIEHSFSWSLTLSFMGQTLKKVLPILLLVAILFSTVSFTNVYFQDFLQSNTISVAEDKYEGVQYPAFTLNAAGAHSYRSFETVKLTLDKNRTFPPEVIDTFYTYKGVSYISPFSLGTNNASLLFPANSDPYWLNYDQTSYDDAALGYLSSAIPGVPQDVIDISYTLYVLDDALKTAYIESNPSMTDAVNNLGTNEVLAILPPTESGATNQTLRLGSSLSFGELVYEGNFSEADNNPHLIDYVEHHLEIAAISTQPFYANINGKVIQSNSPVFLINKETLFTNNLFNGIETFEVYLDPDISEADYAAIEQYVMELGSSADNVDIYSRKDEAEQDKVFMQVISTALAIMLCVLGLFIIICLFTTLYMTLLQRKRSIAIMRAVGMEPKTLGRAIFMELGMYLLYCFVISIIVYFIMMYLMLAEIFSTNITLANTLSMLGSLAICIGAMLIICVFIVRFLLNDVYRENVSTALRTVE